MNLRDPTNIYALLTQREARWLDISLVGSTSYRSMKTPKKDEAKKYFALIRVKFRELRKEANFVWHN